MKKKIMKIGVLSVVFVLALIVFGYITNRGTPELTADMDGATLPRIYFREGEYEVNPLMGYVDEMSVPAVRDTITPLKSNGSLDIRIAGKDVKIKKLTYETLSLDGKKSFGKKEIGKVKEQMTLNVSGMEASKEAVLKITLVTEDKKTVDYYTRVISQDNLHVSECLDFVNQFHTSVMETKETSEISRYLEQDPAADNGTFQNVTLRSDLAHITWGELDPEIVGDIDWNIKETNGVYTAAQLKYQVKRVEDKVEKRYNVKEFFKVRYNKDRMYLLDYDRTMDEVFDRSGSAMGEKGILLGIVDKNVTYDTNKDGSVLSFVQERELWNYDKEADRMSLVFSFRSEENDDVRNRYDQHEIKIISMDKNGSTTFAVYGYMNRGAHEGQVGVAVYYFDIEQGTVAEKAFIPSNKSFLIAEDELGKLVYYNNKENMLYVMVDGTLFKVNLEDGKKEKIVKGLEDGQYVASDDGHLLAYQAGDTSQITLFNFLTDKKYKISEANGDEIVPLGFVLNDFVYGFARDKEAGKTISGENVTPMYKLEIRDSKNKVAKTYEEADIYVLDVIIENNMMTLNRVAKKGDLYTGVAKDYITNNEERKDQGVSLKSISTEYAGRKMRFEYEKGLNVKNTKILMPKQVLFENPTIVSLVSNNMKSKFFVFGKGELLAVYDKAGYAVQHADDVEGVVVSSSQSYVWERGNRDLRHQIEGMESVKKADGESALDACVRGILKKEGKLVDVKAESKKGKSTMDILTEYTNGEGIDLTGCTVEEMCYLIGKDTPVIAMTSSNDAILLVGYTDTMITYIDPDDGNTHTETLGAIEKKVKGSGNTFIGYNR